MDWQFNESNRLVLDIGSLTLRLGFANNEKPKLRWRNMIGSHKKSGEKIYGDDLENLLDEEKYFYSKPLTKGLLVNMDTESELMLKMFEKIGVENQATSLKKMSLTMSYPPMCPNKVKQELLELAFEYYCFSGFSCMSSAEAVYYHSKEKKKLNDPRFALIVESGHSATYVVPVFNGTIINYAAKRLDIGGRLLSNYLRELISFRQTRLENYPKLCNQIKEECCYFSKDFLMDMKRGIDKSVFLLPDPDINQPGYRINEFNRDMKEDVIISFTRLKKKKKQSKQKKLYY